jgi:hypothetical protein
LADSFFLGRGHVPALSKAAAKSARFPRELFDLGEILRRDKPRRDHADASDIGKRKIPAFWASIPPVGQKIKSGKGPVLQYI